MSGFEYPMESDGHTVGDRNCAGCWCDWPRVCSCGGIVHAEFFEADWDNYYLTIQCDRCDVEYICDDD